MTSDIVEQLRAWAEPISSGYEVPRAAVTLYEAADEIESLRTDYVLLSDDYKQLLGDNERLRSRLAEIIGYCAQEGHDGEPYDTINAIAAGEYSTRGGGR